MAKHWESIEHTDARFYETAGFWSWKAEAHRETFRRFHLRQESEQVMGRLVVCRTPGLNSKATDGQPTLFDVYSFHAFFTTVVPYPGTHLS